jgi:phosphoribosyl 1,2-cyclic phosphate phosphodiesterase
MQIEILGSGGAITTPRPGCRCRVCVEAREKGVPYSRSGPSLFVHGPNVLIDTPEESKDQLNRSHVTEIAAGLYSHWHPDHTMGRRVWETRNTDWFAWPQQHTRTDIYLPQQVAADFRTFQIWDHMAYLQKWGVINLIEMQDGDVATVNGAQIRPFRVAEEYVYAFLFQDADARVLIAPDELFGWTPPDDVRGLDLAVIPMGVHEFDAFTGARKIHADHPILKSEATFRQTLDMVRQLDADRVIMTHIEEPDGLSYDDLLRLEARLRAEGFTITFAYDTLLVEV